MTIWFDWPNLFILLMHYGYLLDILAAGTMPRFFKKSQRYNVARNCFLAKIILLDTTSIEFNLLPEVTGTDCLEKVSQVMDIQEVSIDLN